MKPGQNGRGGVIRTRDPCVPNAVRCQAALHPDAAESIAQMPCNRQAQSGTCGVNSKWERRQLGSPTLLVILNEVKNLGCLGMAPSPPSQILHFVQNDKGKPK